MVLLLFASGEAQGQGFLEKLEAAVREQLNQRNASTGGQEPTAPAAQELPSILEPQAATPDASQVPPVPAPVGAVPGENQAPSGRIYLGLEAEEPVGGGIGVRVAALTPQSPAWKAGFKEGDRILAINGFAIAKLDDMAAQLAKTAPGQVVRFLVSRGGRHTELKAVLMDADLASKTIGGSSPSAGADVPAWLGVMVNDLTGSFRQQFGITVFRGAAVTRVSNGSPAAKADIRAGDAIIEAGGKPIERAADLMAWMTSVRPGQKVELMVYRGSRPRVVTVVMEVSPEDRVPPRATSRMPVPNQPYAGGIDVLPPPASVPAGPPSEAAPDANDVVTQLRRENEQLRVQLAEAQKRLLDTQNRLDQILKELKAIGN